MGDWGGGRIPPVPDTVSPRSEGLRVHLADRPGSVQSELRVGHVGVARSSPDYFPLMVMNTILGGAFSSRLNLNLRERHGFTYGVSSAFAARRLPGPFVVGTAVQTEVTAAALTEIFAELTRMRESPVTHPELENARNYLAGIFPLRLQTTEGIAEHLARIIIYDLPDDYLETYRERILAVSAEDVLRVAREHLHPDAASVVVVGDAQKLLPALEELHLAPVEQVDISALEDA